MGNLKSASKIKFLKKLIQYETKTRLKGVADLTKT